MADKRKKLPRPMAIADLLAAAFHGKPAEKRLKEGRIWLVWDAAVGPQIAGRAQPVSFRDGILTVAVASAPWMQQLTFLKKGMIEKLNERLGCDQVRDIYLKAGLPKALPAPAKIRQRKERPLQDEEKLQITEQSAAIADPELREAVTRLLERYTANVKSPE
jgi:predicted nucleic acid-binding Zn ribbon protein